MFKIKICDFIYTFVTDFINWKFIVPINLNRWIQKKFISRLFYSGVGCTGIPKFSTQEFQTQAFVIDVLKEYKIPYKTYGTGIIATLGEGADCVALRADMDALRVQEDTGLPYCSGDSRADARLWT